MASSSWCFHPTFPGCAPRQNNLTGNVTASRTFHSVLNAFDEADFPLPLLVSLPWLWLLQSFPESVLAFALAVLLLRDWLSDRTAFTSTVVPARRQLPLSCLLPTTRPAW